MARKKTVEPPIIPNEYGIVYNGEFLQSIFAQHKKTKTEKLVRLASTSVIMAQIAAWIKRTPGVKWMLDRQIEYRNGNKLLTFATPFIAKLWLVTHSSYPGAQDSAFFFTEAELDRIITKHKYDFKRRFQLHNDRQRPLLCEFDIQKVNREN